MVTTVMDGSTLQTRGQPDPVTVAATGRFISDARPARLGIGLAYQESLRPFIATSSETFDFLEVVPDMFWNDMGSSRGPRHVLTREGDDFFAWAQTLRKPVIPHSIGLSIGSAHRFDQGHVEQMARWRERLDFPWHSDHLSYHLADHGGDRDLNLGLTLPLAFDRETLALVVERVRQVRQRVDRPFLLENSVYFFAIPGADFSEAAFLNRLCADSGAGLVLDLHNLYTNTRNGLVDPERFLAEIDLGHVREIHVAGGMEVDGFYLDAHSGAVPPPVWNMLARVLPRCPNLGGVVFELFGSWLPEIGEAGVAQQLARARAIWDRHHGSQPAQVAR
jgi:uncharacterized protein (UPF0276 family)